LTPEEVQALGCKIPKDTNTRWNSTLAQWEKLFEVRDKLRQFSRLSMYLREYWFTQMHVYVNLLRTAKTATDLLQSDSSTMFTLMTCLIGCLQCQQWVPLLSRRIRTNFNSRPLRATIFFTPGVLAEVAASSESALTHRVAAVQQEVITFGAALLVQCRKFATLAATQEALESEMLLFRNSASSVNGLVGVHLFTKTQFAMLARHPNLCVVSEALCSVCATEASVERMFSCVGRVFSDSRNRMLDDIVESQGFIKFNRKLLLPPQDVVVMPSTTKPVLDSLFRKCRADEAIRLLPVPGEADFTDPDYIVAQNAAPRRGQLQSSPKWVGRAGEELSLTVSCALCSSLYAVVREGPFSPEG
jgi:hypothetical protein